jgi:sortase B
MNDYKGLNLQDILENKTVKVKKINTFEESVNSFKSSDIRGRYERDKMKSVSPLLVRSVIMTVILGVLFYCVYLLGVRIYNDREQEQTYEDLLPKASAVTAPKKLSEPGRMPTLLEMLAAGGNINDYTGDPEPEPEEDYRQAFLKAVEINSDVIGYVVVTGTKISYPILLGEDNSFYLSHNLYKKSSSAGSIFADYTLSENYKDNYNVLLFGHCMQNGTMFRGIKLWFDSGGANRVSTAESMEIKVYTKEGVYVYKLFSAYRTEQTFYMKTRFTDETDYKNFLDTIYNHSVLRKNITYSASETKVCTLVTCTNVPTNPEERYVLHGILKQFIPYQ